ncbi:MAG: hypothetical protein KY469_00595 [Actinobacteria bacterium]|nr:hypothetical protein [Actinomycetota bacterium]
MLATGRTALYLHGVIDETPSALQLAVPADRKKPTLVGVDDVVRSTTLLTSDRIEVDGLSCAIVALALLHLGRRERGRGVLEVVVNALQREKAELSELDAVLDRCGRAPGRATLRHARDALTLDQADSLLELDTRQLARAASFSPYPSPFPFRCPDGRVIHLDVPFPPVWFAWECDSPRSRSGGRSFNTDRTRWTQARRGGWQLGWVTRERLRTDRAGLPEELAEAHAVADPERPPPEATPCRRTTCRVCAPMRASLNR